MECCNNMNIGCINYEKIFINCAIIYDYQYINEISFKDMNNRIYYFIKNYL